MDDHADLDLVRLPDIHVLPCDQGRLDVGKPTEIIIGDLFRLDRYLVEQTEEHAQIAVSLEVLVRQQPELDYTFFIHLTRNGKIVSQVDHQPFGDVCPTHVWREGERYVVEFTIPLPPNTPAGEYKLIGGVYYLPTLERLPVDDSDLFSMETIRID